MPHLSYATNIAILCAYLIGSISSAVLVAKLFGIADPRSHGSHNPGTTNILRLGGKKAAALTLLGDILKAVIPLLIAEQYGFNRTVITLITMAVFIGHIYPVFIHFKGGKGVATAFGLLVTLNWHLGLAVLATWLLTAVVFRYSSVAALTAAILAPYYAWYFTNLDYTVVTGLMSLFLVYRHEKNIRNLFAGKETKIGQRQSPELN
jgi:glycerol-3-phosphate acyltransferase PlsY